MKFCNFCGAKLNDTALFCTKCGQKVAVVDGAESEAVAEEVVNVPEKDIADQPIVEEPVVEEPVAEEPVAEEPSVDEFTEEAENAVPEQDVDAVEYNDVVDEVVTTSVDAPEEFADVVEAEPVVSDEAVFESDEPLETQPENLDVVAQNKSQMRRRIGGRLNVLHQMRKQGRG